MLLNTKYFYLESKGEFVLLRKPLQGCPTFCSLGLSGRRVVLGHMLNTQTLMKTNEKKKGFT